MKTKKLDGVEVWKEFEALATRLNLNVIDRVVYSHLLLHTRLEGKARLHFSLTALGREVALTRTPTRASIHRLAGYGALRLIERTNNGQLVEVRLPAEVPAPRIPGTPNASSATMPPVEPNLDELDFLSNRKLRPTIHAREGGKCFYCRRRTSRRSRCLDHVVPLAKSGQNSYRNLVSCCVACNAQKHDRPAADFLRELYCEARLSRKSLTDRLQQLQALAAGKLRPNVSTAENSKTAPG